MHILKWGSWKRLHRLMVAVGGDLIVAVGGDHRQHVFQKYIQSVHVELHSTTNRTIVAIQAQFKKKTGLRIANTINSGVRHPTRVDQYDTQTIAPVDAGKYDKQCTPQIYSGQV